MPCQFVHIFNKEVKGALYCQKNFPFFIFFLLESHCCFAQLGTQFVLKMLEVFGMKWMSLLIFMFTLQTAAQEVVSFKEWRFSKIRESENIIATLEALEKANPSQFGPEEETKLKQAKNNLDISRELTPQDYFVLYLSPQFQGDPQAYTKAMSLMDPADIAQILIGYDKLIEERKRKAVNPATSGSVTTLELPQRLNPAYIFSSNP